MKNEACWHLSAPTAVTTAAHFTDYNDLSRRNLINYSNQPP